MQKSKYLIDKDETTLQIHYKQRVNMKWPDRVANFVKEDLLFPILTLSIIAILFIQIWSSAELDFHKDFIRILIVCGSIILALGKLLTLLLYSSMMYIWNIWKRIYNKQYYPNLCCVVQKGKIAQKNLNPKIQDKYVFSLDREEIKFIHFHEPEVYENYYQIKLVTEEEEYRLNLCFEESELDELKDIIKKIKAYLY